MDETDLLSGDIFIRLDAFYTLPIAGGRSRNRRLLTEATMRTSHTVCPTGISGPNITKGIFHTSLNRLGIRNKLEIHDFFLIEARKEVGGKG